VSPRLINEQDFKSLDPTQQEALFSLSCLSRNQLWADNVEWTDEEWETHVIQHGKDLVAEVNSRRLPQIRRALGLSNDREIVEERILEGDDLTLRFLAWHLEQHINEIVCHPEDDNNLSEPDIEIYEHETLRAKLEVKRVVSTGNVDEYASSFLQKDWHLNDPRRPSALLLYFPLLITNEWRARTLVSGYQGFIKGLSDWRDDSMYVRVFPAPINTDAEFGALKSTRTFVEGLRDS
jgi:hypothetical protein